MVNLSLSKKLPRVLGRQVFVWVREGAEIWSWKGGPRTACINCKSDNMINLTTKINTCGSDRQVRWARRGKQLTMLTNVKVRAWSI